VLSVVDGERVSSIMVMALFLPLPSGEGWGEGALTVKRLDYQTRWTIHAPSP
jgi:hypothetical protein